MDSEVVMAARLTLDPNNANRGTVRGEGMVERSLQSYGAGRSILASRDGVIIAGNKTFQKAQELGIPVQEIESDGRTLFVIRRTDLDYDDPRARELAIADNRASETGLDWDADVLAALAEDGVDLEQFWFEDELAAVLTATETEDWQSGMVVDHTAVITDEDDPVDQSETRDARMDVYNTTTVRQVQLIMTVEEYHDLVPKMQRIMQQEGLDSNYDVVRHVVNAYLNNV